MQKLKREMQTHPRERERDAEFVKMISLFMLYICVCARRKRESMPLWITQLILGGDIARRGGTVGASRACAWHQFLS